MLNRRAFTKSLPVAAAGALIGEAASAQPARPSTSATGAAGAARLPPTSVAKIRLFSPPNYNANGPQAFPQSNMVVLVDTEAGMNSSSAGMARSGRTNAPALA